MRNIKKAPVKRRRVTNSPIQINIDPVEFADMCEIRDRNIQQVYLSHAADPFMAEMAVYSLVELEGRIIGLEFFLTTNPRNEVSNQERVEKYKKEHLELHTQLTVSLGERFEEIYQTVLAGENECSRANLDNNDGRLYSYVIPKFNPDGTHEPWGPRDVPWNPGANITGKKPRKKL